MLRIWQITGGAVTARPMRMWPYGVTIDLLQLRGAADREVRASNELLVDQLVESGCDRSPHAAE